MYQMSPHQSGTGPYIAGGGGGAVAPARKTNFFSNIVFDFVGLYMGDPCEGLWSLPPQTKILGTALRKLLLLKVQLFKVKSSQSFVFVMSSKVEKGGC